MEADGEEIEEIVVTGSRIKRRDFNTPSPLTTISSVDIAFSGQATIEETLNQMPQVFPEFGRTSNNPTLGPNPNAGAAGVDLRGFGSGRSLVLLNGRRVAPSGTGNSVNLNNIPQFLIDRIELITGGTATVYGSDAIAGVVNFVTKEDYSGFGVEAGMSMSDPGDAEIYDLNIAYGHNFANGRGNLTAYGSVYDRKSLLAADRALTSVVWVDDWESNLIEGGSPTIPAGLIAFPRADLGSGPVNITFNPDSTPRAFVNPDDLYNYAPVNYLQIPMTRYAVGLTSNYDVTERFEGYLEASFIRSEPSQNLAPVPASLGSAEVNLDNPLLPAETRQLFADQFACGPNRACFFLLKRLIELGPRLIDHERDYSRIVTGFRGELRPGWDIDGWVTYTKEDSTETLRNDASRSRTLQGLLVDPATNECLDPTGGCVPLNVFGEGNLSAEGVEFVRHQDYTNKTEQTYKLASVFVTGAPVETWAGPLDMAVGVEWRSADVVYKSDDALFLGDTLGYAGGGLAPVDGTEDVFETYAEALIPLAKDRAWANYLGLEIGARYSDYKHAGGFWTYKAGGEWQPFESLRFRAMRQRSERAPNSRELFEEQGVNPGTYVSSAPEEDLCSASADPRGNDNVEKCLIQGLPADQIGVFEATVRYPVDYIFGGNPDLDPETGDTWTVGAVVTPDSLPGLTFSVDYFDLEVTDTIGSIDAALICFDSNNTANVFCENIERDASGNIAGITELTSNRGLLETTGIDTQIQYSGELPDILAFGDRAATIDVNVYWTHMFTNKEQENPTTTILDCAGYYGWPCDTDARAAVYPEDRITSNLYYSSGPLGLHLTWRWIKGTDNSGQLAADIFGWGTVDLAVPAVDDEHYLDLGLAYSFNERFSARFGITNLLDNDPPQMADAVWDNNTDTSLYDVFGRSYYLSLSAQYE